MNSPREDCWEVYRFRNTSMASRATCCVLKNVPVDAHTRVCVTCLSHVPISHTNSMGNGGGGHQLLSEQFKELTAVETAEWSDRCLFPADAVERDNGGNPLLPALALGCGRYLDEWERTKPGTHSTLSPLSFPGHKCRKHFSCSPSPPAPASYSHSDHLWTPSPAPPPSAGLPVKSKGCPRSP